MALTVRLEQDQRDRIKSGVAVGALHALLAYAFLTGLGFDLPAELENQMKLFDVTEQPPPPPAEPAAPDTAEAEIAKPKEAEGAASPANLRDTPTEIMVPKPEIRIPVPPPLVAAPIAGQGNQDAAGAAEVPGPGTGSGGQGTGLGSGERGSGTGGGGGGRGTLARWIKGRIYDSDDPRAPYEARRGNTVYLRFTIAPNGRVSDCTITRSSGNRNLDAVTCHLIMSRFRYRPARDARGRPIAQEVRGEHVWEVRPEPPPIEVEPDIVDEEEL
jgi:protein TonB